MSDARGRPLAEELQASEARFHGWSSDIEVNWGISAAALSLLEELVHEGDRTLETGVGYSTVVFASRGANHTVVSPFEFEHDRVRSWCVDRAIDLSRTTFIADLSQNVLPALEPTPLDVVLIDGEHSFPIPYIDFWYAGGRLRPGGVLIVDDTQLRGCRILAEFLQAESGRWRTHTKLRSTTAFERLDGPLLPPGAWAAQPWGAKPLFVDRPPLLSLMRSRLQVRTRLRRLVGRDAPAPRQPR